MSQLRNVLVLFGSAGSGQFDVLGKIFPCAPCLTLTLVKVLANLN